MAMGFWCLLDDEQQLLIKITEYFLNQKLETISIPALKKNLGISSYQADLACVKLDEISRVDHRFNFSYSKEKGLTMRGITTQTLEFLTVYFAKRSLNIKVLLNDSLGIGGSRTSFLTKTGISEST